MQRGSFPSALAVHRMAAMRQKVLNPSLGPFESRDSSDLTLLQKLFGRQRESWRLDVVLLLAVLTIVAFIPAIWCGFISLDDGHYVLENKYVRQGLTAESIKWAFTGEVLGLFAPLGMLSLMLDYQLFGLQPWGFHLTSVLLHTCSVMVLFAVLRQITGSVWRSALAAALFAVHPLRVDSVVWISERKDVLGLLFGLLALWAYVHYTRHAMRRRYAPMLWYAAMLVLLMLSLMAKPMLVTFPFLLLLMDFWPLRRWRRLRAVESDNVAVGVVSGQAARSIPNAIDQRDARATLKAGSGNAPPVVEEAVFTARSLAGLLTEKLLLLVPVCIAVYLMCGGHPTAIFHNEPAAVSVSTVPTPPMPGFHDRLLNIPISYVSYLWKTIWFGNLSPSYPFPAELPMGQVAGSTILLILITILVLWQWKKRPWLPVGWLWFVGTMVPVIGLLQIGGFALADRYSYFPSIGLVIMVVWMVPEAVPHMRSRFFHGMSSVVLATLVLFTWIQIGYWKDSVVLYQHAVAVCAKNYRLYGALGQRRSAAAITPGQWTVCKSRGDESPIVHGAAVFDGCVGSPGTF